MSNTQDIGSKQQPINFTPDWSAKYMPEQAEKELSGFSWKGCGWYITVNPKTKQESVMLVTPFDDEGQVFLFSCYTDRNPANDFSRIVNLPTRQDQRGE